MYPPLTVVTVIFAVPAFTAVTTPASTDTTASLDELHVMVWSLAFSGVTSADSCLLSPGFKVKTDGVRLTPFTEIHSSYSHSRYG